jgi:hypothetical protein
VTTPVFAIVGHPNKGKSSIVATLARDESVAISQLPGTTAENREYPMVIDGETLYVLIDTPGFQRARAALEWMQEQPGSSVERPAIVRRFVKEHRDDPRFAAECALLTPVMAGAGILYVVDGSRPFGQEYEAEMEILRWTGEPSLALINLIGEADYSEAWANALGQYFRIVRVFDALTADFDKRVQLLAAFGQIREEWRAPLQQAVQTLQDEQRERRRVSARIIAEAVSAMIVHTRERRLGETESETAIVEDLRRRYKQELTTMEQQCRTEVERVYDYRHLQRDEPVMQVLDEDLFASETWSLFGLTRQQLIATGGLGGAAAGSAIDVAVGGHSLMMGAGLGALIGGVSAWVTADRIADIRIMGLPLGGKALRVGPMRNINFPYVVLGRALLHHRMIEDRTHALRSPLDLHQQPQGMQSLGTSERKPLERLFARLRKQENLKPELVDELAKQIERLMSSPPRSSSS